MKDEREIPWQENSYRKTTALEMSFEITSVFSNRLKRYLLGDFCLLCFPGIPTRLSIF